MLVSFLSLVLWAHHHYLSLFLVVSLIVDPFLGSGEFAIPAIKMGRYFIGIEKDKDTLEDARKYITSRIGAKIWQKNEK
jgi:DNA modification methylase